MRCMSFLSLDRTVVSELGRQVAQFLPVISGAPSSPIPRPIDHAVVRAATELRDASAAGASGATAPLLSGRFPTRRTLTSLLRTSNQNGAPIETARIEMKSPVNF